MVQLTVIMASYNGERYIEEQLDSILAQSYQKFNLLIADDGSTDSTMNILLNYQKKYKNIKIIQNINRLGVVSNFENLISLVETKYISLSDQDDIWHKDKLLVSMKNIEKINIKTPALFHSDLTVIDDKKNIISKSFFKMRGYEFPVVKSLDIMLGRSGVMGNTIVFNQALKKEILPFPKSLEVHDYWIALVNELLGERISCNKSMIYYRIHNNNVSNSVDKINCNTLQKINSSITLPYYKIKREYVLEEFLNRFIIAREDRALVHLFINYLKGNLSKLNMIVFLFKKNFFKKGFLYKVQQIFKIIIF